MNVIVELFEYRPNVRNPRKSEIMLRLILTITNLDHLMNHYTLAKNGFILLAEYIDDFQNSDPYKAFCYWGIAHCLLHTGKDLEDAIIYYDKASGYKRTAYPGNYYVLKSRKERIITLLTLNRLEEAKKVIEDVKGELKDLNLGDDIRNAINRCEALYNIQIGNTSESTLALLTNAQKHYKNIGKRLLFDVTFEIGQYHRKIENYVRAVENYTKSRDFSKKNGDNNMHTMSEIAIILCELITGSKLLQDDNDCNYENSLSNIIVCCQEHELYLNELYAQLLLDHVMGRKHESKLLKEFVKWINRSIPTQKTALQST